MKDKRILNIGEDCDVCYMLIRKNILGPIQDHIKLSGSEYIDLGDSYGRIIGDLVTYKETTIQNLSTYTRMLYPNVVKVISELNEKGYVEKFHKPDSKKKIYIRMTDKLKKIYDEYEESATETAQRHFSSVFTDEDLNNLEYHFHELGVLLHKLDNVSIKPEVKTNPSDSIKKAIL
ncbi:MAG: winged helix DNA-binding protein [Clostridia bacterium]|nr:winged helix DNA-binding protein [Clostridia bacterium]